jgi:hypothetical protein
VHVTLANPDLLAVIVMVSPSVTSRAATAGVASLVMLSLDDDPRSDDDTRSGVPAVVVVSTVIDRGVDAADWLPSASALAAERLHVPSSSVPRSHDVAGKVYEHETGAEPGLDAVIVTTSPFCPPLTVAVTDGVLSFVMLSLLDAPVSEADNKDASVGAAGAVRSSVTVFAGYAAPGPVPPAVRVTELRARVGVTVPSLQPETLTV